MARALQVLGIEVSADLLEQWVGWFAPDPQPILVDDPGDDVVLPLELIDTFGLYGVREGIRQAWLTQESFDELARARRAELVRAQVRHGRDQVPTVRSWESLVGDAARSQGDGHRFLWWPRLLAGHEGAVLSSYINDGRRPSRHRDVATSTWRACERLLPGAKTLAGTFPQGSGPNCFGTVMAATGVEGADQVWMQREPFEKWLADSTAPGGEDAKPGTVMVWRSRDGAAQHAAVTLGSGWALHKPSQGWMSPTKVLAIPEVIASARSHGLRLSRRRIVS